MKRNYKLINFIGIVLVILIGIVVYMKHLDYLTLRM